MDFLISAILENGLLERPISLIFERLEAWYEKIMLHVPNFVGAVMILLVFYYIAKVSKKFFDKYIDRFYINIEINRILSKIIFLAVLGIGVSMSLGALRLDTAVASLLAGAGILGLAIGLAFQDLAINFISGITLAYNKPIKVGDMIETNGFLGIVDGIGLRAVSIRTFQGQEVILPCKDVLQKAIINYNTFGVRRVDIPVGVSYGDDLEKAGNVAKEAVASLEERDHSKEVELFFEGFGDSSVNFSVRFWLNLFDNQSFVKARHDAVIAIHKAFNQNGITIPFPIRTLDFGIKGGEKLSNMFDSKTVEVKKSNGKEGK